MATERDAIVGGDTPFFSPSELPFVRAEMNAALGFEHRPTRFGIEKQPNDKDTRALKLVICAMTWIMAEVEPTRDVREIGHAEFMRQFVAGANNDLIELGVKPLLSISEVKRYASDPSLRKLVEEGRPPSAGRRSEGGE